jgi:hypothetical protein
VAVGAHKRVGIGVGDAVFILGPDGLGQVFQVHLVADAGARRDDAEIVKRAGAPFQEFIALAIALVFARDVFLKAVVMAEIIHHHRVVDHQIHRNQRVHRFRIAAQRCGGVAHGGEVHNSRNAGEVLHQHAGRAIGDFMAGLAGLGPGCDGFDVGFGDGATVFKTQQVFQEDLQRVGQLGGAVEAVLLGLFQIEIGVGLACDRHFATALEAVQ